MALLAGLAVVVGAIAAFRLSLLPFGLILLGASAVGVALGLAMLPHPREVVVGGLLLFSCAQVGYGLGLVISSRGRDRRNGSA